MYTSSVSAVAAAAADVAVVAAAVGVVVVVAGFAAVADVAAVACFTKGVAQVPLEKAAWVQIPQLSLRHPPLGSARRGDKPGHSSCQPLSPCNKLRL